MRPAIGTSLLALILGATLAPAGEAGATSDGLNVELVAEMRSGETAPLMAGEPLRIGFRLTDRTGTFPLGDLHPGAWIRKASEGRTTCRQAVQDYLRRGVNVGAGIDLNGYAFATLNADRTLAVIDPRLDLATSNLLSLTRLDTEVADWHLDQASGRLVLALPEENGLAVVDLFSGRRAATWPTADGPTRLGALPGGDDLWIVAEGEGSLQRLSMATGEILDEIALKPGPIHLAVDADEQRLFALDSTGKLLLIDGLNGAVIETRGVDGGNAILYSPKAEAVLIAEAEAEALRVAYLDHDAAPITIRLPARADEIALDPAGRWLFALDLEAGRLSIVDLARNRATHVLDFAGRPDRLAVSEDYLYLRETEAARVSILHLGSLAGDKMPGVLDVALGAKPGGPARSAPALPTIAALPEGGGALIAHAPDKMLYLYRETGMQAPSNAFRSWTAAPEAVLIHDRSLTEESPGFYQTTALVQEPGAYELVFHLASPAHVACFPLDIEGDRARIAADPVGIRSLSITAVLEGGSSDGEPVTITLDVIDGASREPVIGIRDLRVLVVDPSSGWHWQGFALPAEAPGAYSLSLAPPGPGAYSLFARSRSAGITADNPHRLEVTLE